MTRTGKGVVPREVTKAKKMAKDVWRYALTIVTESALNEMVHPEMVKENLNQFSDAVTSETKETVQKNISKLKGDLSDANEKLGEELVAAGKRAADRFRQQIQLESK